MLNVFHFESFEDVNHGCKENCEFCLGEVNIDCENNLISKLEDLSNDFLLVYHCPPVNPLQKNIRVFNHKSHI